MTTSSAPREVEGTIVCPIHSSVPYVPCRHVWKFMMAGLDDPYGRAEMTIKLPLFMPGPSNGVVAPAWTTVLPKWDDAKNAMVPLAVPLRYSRTESQEPVFGHLLPGEGRRIIRRVFLDWLRGQYRHAPMCSDPEHRDYAFGPQERDRLDLDSTQPIVLLGVLEVAKTGACYKCRLQSEVSDDLSPTF
jgi:hypothetical protein